jgi:hypothetical protein
LSRGNGAAYRDVGDGMEQAMDEAPPQVLDLEIDVMFHAQRITSLHLEEPTGGQYERALKELKDGPNVVSLEAFKITLIAAVAKVDRNVVLGMRKSQIEVAYAFLARLLNGGPPTGET